MNSIRKAQNEILLIGKLTISLINLADENEWIEIEGLLRKGHGFLTKALLRLDAALCELEQKEPEPSKLMLRRPEPDTSPKRLL